jgi:hypothetical protein
MGPSLSITISSLARPRRKFVRHEPLWQNPLLNLVAALA